MSDIQLFRVTRGKASEIERKAVALEKVLQVFFEENLEALFGIRLVASEHSTGKAHKGRIDTLGLDENSCPVIVEYKRSVNEVVVTQGLYYLDWLSDHHGDFKVLVRDRLGMKTAEEIDWENPRLVCIAEDYTKFDEHAVRQIPRNIDLVRFLKFEDDLFLVELVHRRAAAAGKALRSTTIAGARDGRRPADDRRLSRGVKRRLGSASADLRKLFLTVAEYLEDLGDDVTAKQLKFYWAFSRLKNFACLELQKTKVLVHLSIHPKSIKLVPGFSRDMRGVGHFGTGDVEVSIDSRASFEKAKPLLRRAYEGR